MKGKLLLLILFIPFITGCIHKSGQVYKSSGQNSLRQEVGSGKALNNIVVNKQEVETPNCYIDTIMVKDNMYCITVEYIAFLGGDEAVAAARKDGYPVEVDTVISGDTIWHVANDYYIAREDTTRSTYIVSDKVEISLIKYHSSESESGETIQDLKNLLNIYTKENISKQPFIIKVKNGVITSITEFFVP